MTPWQLSQIVKAYIEKKEEDHDHDAWIMWHGAILPKLKTMPDLKDFLSSAKKKQVQKIDEHAILARLKAYQKRVEQECQSSQN
jgi:hypothetical protein